MIDKLLVKLNILEMNIEEWIKKQEEIIDSLNKEPDKTSISAPQSKISNEMYNSANQKIGWLRDDKRRKKGVYPNDDTLSNSEAD